MQLRVVDVQLRVASANLAARIRPVRGRVCCLCAREQQKSVCACAAKSDRAAKSGAGFRQVGRGTGALNTRAIYSLTHVRA